MRLIFYQVINPKEVLAFVVCVCGGGGYSRLNNLCLFLFIIHKSLKDVILDHTQT